MKLSQSCGPAATWLLRAAHLISLKRIATTSPKRSLKRCKSSKRFPKLKMTADFSHFVVVGEFYGGSGESALERMQPIIERIAHVHGRISNGESVQVDVDVGDGNGDARPLFYAIVGGDIQIVAPDRTIRRRDAVFQRTRPAALRDNVDRWQRILGSLEAKFGVAKIGRARVGNERLMVA